MSWNPTFDHLIVQRAATKTHEGTVEIPDAARVPQAKGVIVAVGPGRLLPSGITWALSLFVGQEVLFSPFAGIPIADLGEDFLLLREDEVLAWRTPQPSND
jgi:chaperonin GroES